MVGHYVNNYGPPVAKVEHTVCETELASVEQVAGVVQRRLNDSWRLLGVTYTSSQVLLIFSTNRWG